MFKTNYSLKILIALTLMLKACTPQDQATTQQHKWQANAQTVAQQVTNPKAKAYWYNGEAEITSYELSQARYGELHDGKAVLVFVTEPFSPQTFTKADRAGAKDVSVLKLNATKKFNTGIYPYSIMTSSFFPFENGKYSMKISSSSQEWCGHTYMELNHKKDYEVQIHSYFQGENKADLKLKTSLLEDDFWTRIRLHPEDLPMGKIKVIPAFSALRLLHKDMAAYRCEASQTSDESSHTYMLFYPDLKRSLAIRYEKKFPHTILSWEESYASGWGNNRKKMTTTATRIKTIRSDYWNKNTPQDIVFRKELGLE
ncbi:MAG: septum formation inhibitor Maf [Saprospiraceae bacterium]